MTKTNMAIDIIKRHTYYLSGIKTSDEFLV